MRLIDADTLIKNLSFLYTKNRVPNVPVDMRAKETLTTIMEQPTAYDVDEVIKRLKKLRDCKYLTGITNNAYEFGACDALNDAIRIIKTGGKNDNNL